MVIDGLGLFCGRHGIVASVLSTLSALAAAATLSRFNFKLGTRLDALGGVECPIGWWGERGAPPVAGRNLTESER